MADRSLSGPKRDFSRSAVTVQAEVTVRGEPIAKGPTDNLSLKGLYMRTAVRVPVDTGCEVVLSVGGQDAGPYVRMTGRVARVDDQGLGIEFEEILGVESYHHLQQLVLWNSLTPERAEEEFQQHLGIKPIDH